MAIKFTIRRQGASADAPPLLERVFDEPIITIGSDGAATLPLDDPSIAPEQAIIINEEEHLLFINRAPGTELNGETLGREARRPLSDGDTLRLGSYVIRLSLNHSQPAPARNVQPRDTTPRTTPPTPTSRGERRGTPGQATGAGEPPVSSPPFPPPSSLPPSPPLTPPTGEGATNNSFAAILDSLRTEEDSFYFEVINGGQGRRRVAIENAEMLVGWDATGQNISCHSSRILAARAVVRKDWSGVVVQPYGVGMVSVNGEPVESVRRLRNGDRLTLLPTAVATQPNANFLIFHEPATLVVLDSLLPQQLPPPVAPAPAPPSFSGTEGAPGATTATQTTPAASKAAAPRRLFASDRRYFGYFTLAEVVIMVCGTLVAAVIIFLILEYL